MAIIRIVDYTFRRLLKVRVQCGNRESVLRIVGTFAGCLKNGCFAKQELDALSAKRIAKEEAMKRQREFYESELRNNQEARKKMEITELNSIKARDVAGEMERKRQELFDQVKHATKTIYCFI